MATATFIQDEKEFDTLVQNENVLVVDLTATWCGPCKLISSSIDDLAKQYSNRAKVFKLDLDSNKGVASRFGIKSIPAVMFFVQGELKETLIGVKPYEEFTKTIEKYVS